MVKMRIIVRLEGNLTVKHYFVNKKASFQVDDENALSSATIFIEDNLTKLGIDKKLVMKTVLLAEETIALFLEKAKEGADVRVQIKKRVGNTEVVIKIPGSEVDLFGAIEAENIASIEDDDVEAENAIRAILLKAEGEKIKYSYTKGENRVRILADQGERSMIALTLGALVLGILFGFLMNGIMPQILADGISKYALDPIKTIFMNSLKMIIAPVVFFSIVSCISQFQNLSELGRIGVKVVGMYFFTTIIAVLVAMGIFSLIKPGEFGFALSLNMSEVSVNTDVDTSLLTMIVNIFPNNFVKAFLESDTLQIIFLGVLCGIAVGMIGEYSSILKDFFEACNSLFLTITVMIAKFIPVAVFCSTALMVKELGGASFLAVLGSMWTNIISILCMMTCYGVLLAVMGGLNPLKFYSKHREGMITAFTLCSSSACMPTNMRICTDKLGVPLKICSFSIPLGATINMDGACIFLTVNGLFLARAFGIEVTPSMMISIAFTIIMLSLGAPGVPGSGLVCLGIVLKSLNVPVESMALIMGIAPILDMFDTMNNITGDVAAAVIVSKSEGLLDVDKYNE